MKTLIIVDVQVDFLPGGALAIDRGDAILPIIEKIALLFPLRIATQDWHPPHHVSFASTHGRKPFETVWVDGRQQILWPDHCVVDTPGSQLHPAILKLGLQAVIQKGSDQNIDSYSVFFDNVRLHQTLLEDTLHRLGATELFFCGLATDYCVKYSVLDACSLGWPTTVIVDACQGVDDAQSQAALKMMEQAGARLMLSKEIR